MKMTLGEVANAVSAHNNVDQFKNLTLTSVAFDTRQLDTGALFVPLVGENDGHDFIQSAINNGASATLWKVGHPNPPKNFPVIEVDDPLKALQSLSQHYLQKINPTVIAITGSNGKTTTKDMVASILGRQFNVTKTYANFNNEIGVPITVLSMATNTEMLVVEMGMDRPGQLDFLSRLVKPDVALITMIGEAHIEFFGTRDKIADAKMEITHGLRPDGVFIYDGDEPLLRDRAKPLSEAQQTFGRGDENTIFTLSSEDEAHQTNFKTNLWPEINFKIPMMGDYNVNNAMAAILVGRLFHVPTKEIKAALGEVDLTANRTEWVTGLHREAILSDVYNSNPTAVKEVLKAFSTTPVSGKRIIVLGDMLELGDQSKQMHADLNRFIDPASFSDVYLVGNDMKALYERLKERYSDQHLHYYRADQLQQLAQQLDDVITSDDEVLLKASHGIHLEKVLAVLTK